jgi:tRNA(Arg) A34 adenosine deaminase TadA
MSDAEFLRRAISLAAQNSLTDGDPFGAILVKDGVMVAQRGDRSVALSDPTFHAELSLISDYCRANRLFSLEGYTLYSSTEPCLMCSGAIHWARISRIVFSVPQGALQQQSGGKPKPSCESLLNLGHRRVEVVGPLLLEEGLAVLKTHRFNSKLERHARLFASS